MARERCDFLSFGAKTLASTGPCLVYGAMLSSRAGGASLILADHPSMGSLTPARFALRLYTSSATGTVSVTPTLPLQFDRGIVCSMSAKGLGTVFFSHRA